MKRKTDQSIDEVPNEEGVDSTADAFPGPSPNPTTNRLIADVVLRGASVLFNRGLEEQLRKAHVNPAAVKRALGGKTMGKSLATYAATKLATRSIPGLLVVGGGLMAKTIYDRRAARRKAVRNIESAEPGDKAED